MKWKIILSILSILLIAGCSKTETKEFENSSDGSAAIVEFDDSKPQAFSFTPAKTDFVQIKEKDARGKAHRGSIVKLSSVEAEIKSSTRIDPLCDLKFLLVGQNDEDIPIELYAKVIDKKSQDRSSFIVHFTSMPKVIENYLKGLLDTC